MLVDINDFFREASEKVTIPTQNQQVHWLQMQQLLQPTAVPIVTKSYKLYYVVAATIATIICFILVLNKPKQIAKPTYAPTNITTVKTEQPTVTPLPIITTPAATNTVIQPIIATKPPNKIINTTTTNKASSITQATQSVINKQANFYIDLTKAPELFTANANETINLHCKQGTVLHIPANEVIDAQGKAIQGDVNIVVQEYYRYDSAPTVAPQTPSAGMLKYEIYQGTTKVQIQNPDAVTIIMKAVIKGASTLKVMNANDALTPSQIRQMQWVTNDKFVADSRTKVDYIITINKPIDASKFVSYLVFEKDKAILAGDIMGNNLQFNQVPTGETVYFVSFGKMNNHYFNCSKRLVTGNKNITEVNYIEITETAYSLLVQEFANLGKE